MKQGIIQKVNCSKGICTERVYFEDGTNVPWLEENKQLEI